MGQVLKKQIMSSSIPAECVKQSNMWPVGPMYVSLQNGSSHLLCVVPRVIGTHIDPMTSSPSTAWVIEDSDDEEEPQQVDVAEIYSPPRVCAVALLMGLTVGFSHDLVTGVDLLTALGRAIAWHDIGTYRPTLLMSSAPCTIFSTLQNLNRGRVPEETRQHRWDVGMSLLDFAMKCCRRQHDAGRYFVHEHPRSASSWMPVPSVTALMDLPDVYMVQ